MEQLPSNHATPDAVDVPDANAGVDILNQTHGLPRLWSNVSNVILRRPPETLTPCTGIVAIDRGPIPRSQFCGSDSASGPS